MKKELKKTESKYMKVRNLLREFIDDNSPGTKLPSYPDMIRRYNVGQSTIDRALREFDEQKLIVREFGRGIFISSRAGERNIGVVWGRDIFCGYASPVCRSFIQIAEKRAQTNNESVGVYINIPQVPVEGYDLMVQRDLLDSLTAGKFDGLILLHPRGPGEIQWLNSQKIPLVVMTNCPGEAHGVDFDFQEVSRLATSSLAEQGCKRIALVSLFGHQRDQGYFSDLNGYYEALAAHGIDQYSELIWDKAGKPSETSIEPDNNSEIGYLAAMELLGNPTLRPDGLVSTDDMATVGILAAMRKLKLEPGRDIRIATHVNRGISVMKGYENELTMVEVDPEQLVNTAFYMLERLMNGEKIPPGTVSHVKDGIKLVGM